MRLTSRPASLPTGTVNEASCMSAVTSAKLGLRIMGMHTPEVLRVMSEMLGPQHEPFKRPVSSQDTALMARPHRCADAHSFPS